MKRVVGLAVAVLLVCLSSAAEARKIYVDDDRGQCPHAAFTTVQAAVDASAAGDIIRVCGGTYAERIEVPADKVGLRLQALPARAAEIVPPAGGLPLAGEGPAALALVTLRAPGVVFANFRLTGPLTAVDRDEACKPSDRPIVGIDVPAPRALVDGNHLDRMALDCRPPQGAVVGLGILVHEGDDSLVDRSRITGTPRGIEFVNAVGRAQRNVIFGAGACGFCLFQASVKLQANEVTGTYAAVSALFAYLRVFGNQLHDNEVGVDIEDGVSGELRANRVVRNRTGILLEGIGNQGIESSVLVRRNTVLDSAEYGIHAGHGGTLLRSGYHVLRDNVVLRSGILDCFDETFGDATAGTNDTWTNNIGPKDDPNVCRRP